MTSQARRARKPTRETLGTFCTRPGRPWFGVRHTVKCKVPETLCWDGTNTAAFLVRLVAHFENMPADTCQTMLSGKSNRKASYVDCFGLAGECNSQDAELLTHSGRNRYQRGNPGDTRLVLFIIVDVYL